LSLGARATEGAELRLRLADGTTVPLTPAPRPEDIPAGVRAFDHDTLNLRPDVRPDRYAGWLRGTRIGEPGPVLAPALPGADAPAVLEAVRGGDTAPVRWPLPIGPLDPRP